MSCYVPMSGGPVSDDEPHGTAETPLNLLREQDWRGLLYLSHADKARAFDEYAGFYMSTNGQTYDSDTFQLSQYIDDYHQGTRPQPERRREMHRDHHRALCAAAVSRRLHERRSA